jgi:NADP-dependent 3-hydroxy acid dehydrogenase YdfG
MEEDQWEKVIDVNLKSFYYITRPIVEIMFVKKW